MDKLTIGQKASAYDEAIRKAQDALHTSEFINITDLFPELKENDDERIKKTLINLFKGINKVGDFTNKEIIAWLEKQGEQKPANKVEPKFKVGNWYQCTKDFFGKGVTFDKNTAYYCAEEGCLLNECHIAIVKDLYDNFKLWTIDDAKPGDVLVDKYNDIGIFRSVKDTYWYSYIYLGCDGEFRAPILGGLHEQAEVHPATKEQRDLLFQKMKEAGYEWDAERKKSKKINSYCKGYQETGRCFVDGDDCEAKRKTPAWSEEDERMIISIANHLEKQKNYQLNKTNIEQCQEWLNSLKQRIDKL